MKRFAGAWLVGWYAFALFSLTVSTPFDLPHTLHWGHDAFGRALIWLVPQASLFSSLLALGTVAVTLFFASFLGGLLALAPPAPTFFVGRILDFFLSFPSLLISITLSAFFKPGWITLLAAILMGTLPSALRMAYVRSREIAQEDFVHAARSLGAGSWHLVFKHLLPHLWNWMSVKTPNLLASCVLAEATLTLLGLGAPLGHNTWGALIQQGKDYLIEAPWISASASIPLFITLLALQALTKNSTSD